MQPTKNKRRPARVAERAIQSAPSNDLLDLYIEELSRTPVLSAVAQKALARKMRDTSLSEDARATARDQLISGNLRFAFAIAKKYQNRGLPLEDLVSEANAGLCRAADKYDPDVGVNFISYAVWWIRQAIFSAIASKARAVRLPVNRAGDLSRIGRAKQILRDTLGREPTLEEIARLAELSVDVVRGLTGFMYSERSLDEPVGDRSEGNEGRTMASILVSDAGDSADDVTAALEAESRREALLRALERLPERDRRILILYYGLETGEPATLSEIAQMLGVTRERIRQLRDRALAALRSGKAADHLRGEWAA
jgi:RNA polymerase primary sigma factor